MVEGWRVANDAEAVFYRLKFHMFSLRNGFPDQGAGCAVMYLHHHIIADLVFLFGKYDDFVLVISSEVILVTF